MKFENKTSVPYAKLLLMQEADFWNLLRNTKGVAAAVEKALKAMPAAEIESFDALYWSKQNELHRWDVWGAGYVISGGMSDDSFQYFKAYVIGKGQAAFEAMRNDPDSFGEFVTEEEPENESLDYAARAAYEAITDGEKLPYRGREGSEPDGKPWDEDAVYDLFPKLAEQFG